MFTTKPRGVSVVCNTSLSCRKSCARNAAVAACARAASSLAACSLALNAACWTEACAAWAAASAFICASLAAVNSAWRLASAAACASASAFACAAPRLFLFFLDALCRLSPYRQGAGVFGKLDRLAGRRNYLILAGVLSQARFQPSASWIALSRKSSGAYCSAPRDFAISTALRASYISSGTFFKSGVRPGDFLAWSTRSRLISL